MIGKRVLVIGLGQFGTAIVESLWEAGAEVVAIDESADAVDAIKDRTSAAFVGDATVIRTLEGIGAKDFDVAVVTMGEHFEPSVLCVATLARMGVREILARAATNRRADVLRAVGATRVVQLEAEMGRRLAADLLTPLAQDLVEVAANYRVVPWAAHGPLVGKTLASSGLRNKYRLNVIGVRKTSGPSARLESPNPEYAIVEGDTLLLVGEGKDVSRFVDEVGG